MLDDMFYYTSSETLPDKINPHHVLTSATYLFSRKGGKSFYPADKNLALVNKIVLSVENKARLRLCHFQQSCENV